MAAHHVIDERLGDCRKRAHALASRTGIPPLTFYEYQQYCPIEPPNLFTNFSVGAAIGAGIGAAIGLLFKNPLLGSVIGVAIGGLFGVVSETERGNREAAVNDYGKYLESFALAHGCEKTVKIEVSLADDTRGTGRFVEREQERCPPVRER